MTARWRLAALLAAVAVNLAGCTGEVVDDSPGAQEAAPAPSDQASGPQQADPHGDLTCDDATLAAIDGTIGGQLDAFATGDYQAALGFASSRFRAGTDAERFGALIAEAYPFLLDTEGHTSTYCVADGASAQVLVTVEPAGAPAQEMVYRLANEGGDWRIDVAGLVDPDDPETAIEV